MTSPLKVVAAIREALQGRLTPGPWRWWTSNSFRRLSSDATGKDGDVLYAFNNQADRHPDICISDADAALIQACNPDAITTVLDALNAALERVKVLEAALERILGHAEFKAEGDAPLRAAVLNGQRLMILDAIDAAATADKGER